MAKRIFKTNDGKPGLAGSSLIRPSYNDDELKKVVDVTVDELLPPPKRRDFNLVTLDQYNQLLLDFDELLVQFERANVFTEQFRLRIDDLEAQLQDLQNQLESAGELEESLKKQITELNDKLTKSISDLNAAIQRATQAEIKNAELTGQISGLNAQIAALQSQINSLNSLISGGAAAGGGGTGGPGGTTGTRTPPPPPPGTTPPPPRTPPPPGTTPPPPPGTKPPPEFIPGYSDFDTGLIDTYYTKYPPDKYIVLITHGNAQLGGSDTFQDYPFVELVFRDYEGKIISGAPMENAIVEHVNSGTLYSGKPLIDNDNFYVYGTNMARPVTKEKDTSSNYLGTPTYWTGFLRKYWNPTRVFAGGPGQDPLPDSVGFMKNGPVRVYENNEVSDYLRPSPFGVYQDANSQYFINSIFQPCYGTVITVIKKPRVFPPGSAEYFDWPGRNQGVPNPWPQPVGPKTNPANGKWWNDFKYWGKPEYTISVKLHENTKWMDIRGEADVYGGERGSIDYNAIAPTTPGRSGGLKLITPEYGETWSLTSTFQRSLNEIGLADNLYNANSIRDLTRPVPFKGWRILQKNKTEIKTNTSNGDEIVLDGTTAIIGDFDWTLLTKRNTLTINFNEFHPTVGSYNYIDRGSNVDLLYCKIVDMVMPLLHTREETVNGQPIENAKSYIFSLVPIPQTAMRFSPLVANWDRWKGNEGASNWKSLRGYPEVSPVVRSDSNVRILYDRWIYDNGVINADLVWNGVPRGSFFYGEYIKQGGEPRLVIPEHKNHKFIDLALIRHWESGPIYKYSYPILSNLAWLLRTHSPGGERFGGRMKGRDSLQTGFKMKVPDVVKEYFDFYDNDDLVDWKLIETEGYQLGNGPSDICGNKLMTSDVTLNFKIKPEYKAEGNVIFRSGVNDAQQTDRVLGGLDLNYFNSIPRNNTDSFGIEYSVPFNPYRAALLVPFQLWGYSLTDIEDLNNRIKKVDTTFQNFLINGNRVAYRDDTPSAFGFNEYGHVDGNIPILFVKDVEPYVRFDLNDIANNATFIDKKALEGLRYKIDEWDIDGFDPNCNGCYSQNLPSIYGTVYETELGPVRGSVLNWRDKLPPSADPDGSGKLGFLKLLGQTKAGSVTYKRQEEPAAVSQTRPSKPVATVFVLFANYKPLGSPFSKIDIKRWVLTSKWQDSPGGPGGGTPPPSQTPSISVTLQRDNQNPTTNPSEIVFNHTEGEQKFRLDIKTIPLTMGWEIKMDNNISSWLSLNILNDDSVGEGSIQGIVKSADVDRVTSIQIRGRNEYQYVVKELVIRYNRPDGDGVNRVLTTIPPINSITIGKNGNESDPDLIRVLATNTDWTYETTTLPPGITVSRNGNTLTVLANKNETDSVRTFTLRLIPTVASVPIKEISVVQDAQIGAPSTIYTNIQQLELPATVGDDNIRTFDLQASNQSVKWEAFVDGDQSWISITDSNAPLNELKFDPDLWKTSITGTGTKLNIGVKILDNNGGARKSTIKFKTNKSGDNIASAYVTVSQKEKVSVSQETCNDLLEKLAYNPYNSDFILGPNGDGNLTFETFIVTRRPENPGIYLENTCESLVPAPIGWYYTESKRTRFGVQVVYWDGKTIYANPSRNGGSGSDGGGKGDSGGSQAGGQDIEIVKDTGSWVKLSDIEGTWYVLRDWFGFVGF